MEPGHREDETAPDPQATERSRPNNDQEALTVPFASEGLERVRDSHC